MPSIVQTMLKRAIDVAASGVRSPADRSGRDYRRRHDSIDRGEPDPLSAVPARTGKWFFTCYKFRTMIDERDAAGHPRLDFEGSHV
jgi:hypothetical protein